MASLATRLETLRQQALQELNTASDEPALARWRNTYLGRNGALAGHMRSFSQLAAEDRPAAGQAANALKRALETAFEDREGRIAALALDARFEAQRIDVTLPARRLHTGALHPTTQMLRRVVSIFRDLGFRETEGPEVELDWYNFEALNIPPDHPARDMWDTFYVNPPAVLLRTHTSPVQVRMMEKTQPPVRVVVPGRCYRYEAQDASHEWMFHQVEGLAVDEGLTMADLKGVLVAFAQRIFWPDTQCRFRCDYFPFVEPGMELAVQCPICRGSGCRVCKQSGWIELLGAGMVHPKVLRKVGYDPEKVSGFAFGMGLERIAMVANTIDDIRLFHGNDLRFLQQFA
ncbi:MAG: phenylalanine--tRNA ligase subunit alpha [Chloroflexi bacterium]|nr:phenylalanine--tRNA ligase subunit alpha [Chloroflexota bacterium]